MKVPLLDLKQQNTALLSELRDSFDRVMNSGQFILGPEVEALEKECAALLRVKHAIGVSSGTDAILLALMTLGIGHGDEVVCPSFTFFATAGCIARTGAKPVFCDSSDADFNVTAVELERCITPRTKALMPVHLFGQAADMDAIMEVAARHNLPVIEDAAQALSAEFNGRSAGAIGSFGTYSFFPSKNLGGFGDSGLLVTNDDELAAKARIFRTHGSKPKYFHKYVGGNFRIDPMQAALLRVKLPHLASYTARRRENADYYTAELSKLKGVGSDILLPNTLPGRSHIWNQYTLQVQQGRRDSLIQHLKEREIGSEIYYPLPMHLQECFAQAGQSPESLPVCERLAKSALSIPIYPELTRPMQEAVVQAIGEFLNGVAK